MTLEFWVPLEKAQVFADGCKDLFEPVDRVIVLALLARQRWRAGLWTSCCVVKCVVPVSSTSDDLFSGMCRATANKEAALVLDCGDEAQQVQERENEGAKNLPAGPALIKAPSLTAGGQEGILFLNGFKSFTSPTPKNPPRYVWYYVCVSRWFCV